VFPTGLKKCVSSPAAAIGGGATYYTLLNYLTCILSRG
jgi:hypothetical protein